ncbi:MAG: type II toxin-antitoxin system YafQ family toxin [Muricauda sp.]|nr:type II toxin-antitoxin system YafQ family toxin [Allomuricauda sp.]MBA4747025.1 type II toxin-antitoxin system YafQ family toxin [Allomuricauda sp.]
MFKIVATSRFKKDLKKIKSNKSDYDLVVKVLKLLKKEGVLGIPKEMRPHRLHGRYKDNWECHIKPDLLIIWIQIDADNVISLVRVGSHSKLFR